MSVRFRRNPQQDVRNPLDRLMDYRQTRELRNPSYGLVRQGNADGLGLQGVELVGHDGGGDVGESVINRAMFREPQRRELLDVTDDGLGDVSPVQKGFIEKRNWQGFHIFAHTCH